MPTRKGHHLSVGLCSQISFLGFPAKQVESWSRDFSKPSIRRRRSFIRRQSLHHLLQTREIGGQPPRALLTPADAFLEDCRLAQQHQFRAFSQSMTPDILGTILQIADFRLPKFHMAASGTVGAIPPTTQCTVTVHLYFGTELSR